MRLQHVFLSLVAVAAAVPASVKTPVVNVTAPGLGLSFDNSATKLPLLKLPYATYRAYDYNVQKDVSAVGWVEAVGPRH